MKNNKLNIALMIGAIFLLSSCADARHIASTELPGVFYGLWHGLILPYAFIWSLFDTDSAIYAVNNSGHWYDFGFAVGACSHISSITRK